MYIPSPPLLVSPNDLSKNWSLPSYPFLDFSFLPFIKRRGIRNYVYSSKNLWNNICFFLSVVEHFAVFWKFLLLFVVFSMDFCKVDHIKQQADNRVHPPTKNNKAMKTFQTNKPKRLLRFWEVKDFGWFKHIRDKKTHFRIICDWHDFILRTIWIYIIWIKVFLG